MTGYADAAARYRTDAVTTAGPQQLVLMLYEAAIASVQGAQRHLADGPGAAPEAAHRSLTKAQDIVLELQMSLDHDAGGPIATSLDALYGFCIDRLVAANLGKDPGPLGGVAAVLTELRDAWSAALREEDR